MINTERRRITVHLVGVEKEADLIPLFEVLLPLIPNTDLCIHMIGNNVSKDIPPQQRAMMIQSAGNKSSVFVTLTTSFYTPQHLDATAFQVPGNVPPEVLAQHNFGTDKPDLVIALNASLVVHQEWGQVVAMVAQSKTKMLITERVEQLCNAAEMNLPRLGTQLTVATHPNPFRQPLYDFKKDVNLPGWSNGFIMGINFE
jgi:hypothetical protein